MVRIIVEFKRNQLLDEYTRRHLQQELTACLIQHQVRLLRSFFSLDGQHAICELEAADAESVRESYRRAGISFERIWTAQIQTDQLI
jgi:hypothetical protein